jgi:hypothetical protein
MVLRASVTVDPGSGTNSRANCKFKADGRAGAFRLALLGDLVGASDVLNADGPIDLSAANVNLMGRVETDAGATLTELLRLDRIISVDKQPGRLVTAKGPPKARSNSVVGSMQALSMWLSMVGYTFGLRRAAPS